MIEQPNKEIRRTFSTLVELLRWRATQEPDQPAYVFLLDGETETQTLTYQELDQRVRTVGAFLQQQGATGERVLLLYPPGIDYVVAFWGCLYAGAVAVPAYPPRPNRPMPRIQAIVADAQAKFALTTTTILTEIDKQRDQLPDLAHLHWIDSTHLDNPDSWQPLAIHSETIAYLQYTSGSTSLPKGVMVSHGNLIYNLEYMYHSFGLHPNSISVCWLPPFHDMGLIEGLLEPVYGGFLGVSMSPTDFIQKPIRWLQAIHRYRGTHSGGPNFAYDLCVRKTTPEQRAQLDLSCWENAYNGAEPVRAETIQRFVEAFAPSGFQPHFAFPCYGLAEATLMVSGSNHQVGSVFLNLDAEALEQHQLLADGSTFTVQELLAASQPTLETSRTWVSSGRLILDTQLVIAHPEKMTRCSPTEIGEIWVSGPTVAQGYWRQSEATQATFHAYLQDTGEGPFLRTGDLGFLYEGQLFVTGRIKDMILVRGRNHYPQDIELTVEESHAAIRPGCVAAFSINVANEEQLVIVAELAKEYLKTEPQPIIQTIRLAVSQIHEIPVYGIVLITPNHIPKTSSGKIQRHAAREQWQAKKLPVVDGGECLAAEELPAQPPKLDGGERLSIAAWLVERISQQLRIPAHELQLSEPLAQYGLDSAVAVSISGELESWLGRKLSPTLLYDYPTVEKLAAYLAGEAESLFPIVEKTKMPAHSRLTEEPIAIVGLGCRLPGAASPQAFWELLQQGVDAISEVPASRWNSSDFYQPEITPGKMNSRWGGFLEQIDQFDAPFFGISPREAQRMDPQQRLLLEVTWEALENAGIMPASLQQSNTGVFVGISGMEYGQQQLVDSSLSDPYAGTGSALSIAANRLSYFFDWHGPSLAIDTACSSSLVAIHTAVQSLQRGECALAVAGGVNLILSPGLTVNFSQAGFMAEDGRCKPFDAQANGYVRSEGAGVVLLKPLSQAQADGHIIYGLIAGTAVNQDGRSNGLTAPNRQAQESVIRQAIENAGISPAQIQYVETHGTGTPLGDPIEALALAAVLQQDRPIGQKCAIGSVKSNIGHLEAAAGIASVIKVALAMHHQQLPPTLHYRSPNPAIPFEQLPLYVQDRLTNWQTDEGQPMIAGISSFGFGGTNAHLILKSLPRPSKPLSAPTSPPKTVILPLSAKNQPALLQLADQYAQLLTQSSVNMPATAATASLHRSHHAHRLAVVAQSATDAITTLGDPSHAYVGQQHPNHRPKLLFVFSGQGTQWAGMGQQLFEQEPVFRTIIEECDRLLQPLAGWSLRQELFADPDNSRLEQTDVAQPAIFAIQIALAALWQSWGIEPQGVVGHSMGEVAAAYCAGIFSLPEALQLIYQRGRIMHQAAGQGKMLVLEMSSVEAQKAIAPYSDDVDIAAINSPSSVVLSGKETVLQSLISNGYQGRGHWLAVNYAFHSPQMAPLQTELCDALSDLHPQPPTRSIFSTVTGELAQQAEFFGATYWGRNLRQPVQFAAAIKAALEAGYDLFVEIAAHPALSSAIREILTAQGDGTTTDMPVLPSLRRQTDEREQLLRSLAQLYVHGLEINWQNVQAGISLYSPMLLPTYPWQKQSYWLPTPSQQPILRYQQPALTHLPDWLYEIVWQLADPPTVAPSWTGHWLILADVGGLGEQIAQKLREKGVGVTVCQAAQSPAHWQEWLAKMPALTHILYLWHLDPSPQHTHPALANLLPLLSALVDTPFSAAPRLWVVTRGVHPLFAQPMAQALGQAPVWGLGRTLSVEHPEYWGGLIDLDADAPAHEAEQLLTYLGQDSSESQLVFRQQQVYVPRLQQRLMETMPTYTFQANATYLISGGLGGLGLQLAQWMVANGARRLVLLNRIPLPPRWQWDQQLDGEVAGKISQIQALETQGATVLSLEADVSDAHSLRAAFAQIAAYQLGGLLPPLRGVIHAAGVAHRQPLLTLSPEQLAHSLAAKIAGSWQLHELTKEMDLQFFVLFSSVSAVLGSKELGHYAAGNQFMDSLAHYRHGLGLPALSINWGPWTEVGMTVDSGEEQRLWQLGFRGFVPAQALSLLGQLLSQSQPQLIALDIDWHMFRSIYELAAPSRFLSQLSTTSHLHPTPIPQPFATPNSPTTINNRQTILSVIQIRQQLVVSEPNQRLPLMEKYLQERLGQALRMPADQITLSANVLELGLDSILVMELIRQFQSDLGVGLFMREIFEKPSLTALADYILAELKLPSYLPLLATPQPSLTINHLPPTTAYEQTARNQTPIAFILSSPRAGSTLLRAMLAGHPNLFCPPELHLLPYSNLADWQTDLHQTYLHEGLQRALMELHHWSPAESKAQLMDWVAEKRPIPTIYTELQQAVAPRLLIDKSPSYALRRETLERAEQLFGAAKYIHLVRHPYAMIDSFVRNRLDKLIGESSNNPERLAEEIWATTNQNIWEFCRHLPADRHLLVYYEQLVREPEKTVQQICQFLGQPFHPALLQPYDGQRMTDGVYAQSLPIGDPNFHQHAGIDPTLGENWRQIQLTHPLAQTTRQIATQLGYELPHETPLISLIPLQPKGEKPPLFLVAPNGSTVFTFGEFVRQLGQDQPVYGLEHLGLDGKQPPHDDIHQMAAHYVKELQAVQPTGPYLLGGRCFGGIVVYEMGQQLQKQGQKVAMMAILDVLVPPHTTLQTWRSSNMEKEEELSARRHIMYRLLYMLRQGPLKHLMWYRRLRQLQQEEGMIPKVFGPQAQFIRDASDAHFRARLNYTPERFSGRITLFANSEHTGGRQLNWAELTDEGVDIHLVPGDHLTMFQAPNAAILAEKFRVVRDQALVRSNNKQLSKLGGQHQTSELLTDQPKPSTVAQPLAASTLLESQLLEIWQRLADRSPIGVQDHLLSLVKHPLWGVYLCAAMSQALGMTVTVPAIAQAPTIAELAELLSTTNLPDWSPVVPLNDAAKTGMSSQLPFFCIPDDAGTVLSLTHLAPLLNNDRPFYGLQPLGLEPNQSPHLSIPEIATFFLSALRQQQPTGPYYLGGHAFGGLVAFELAQQLLAQGETVAHLAIIDTLIPPNATTAVWYPPASLQVEGHTYPSRFYAKLIGRLTYRWQLHQNDRTVPSAPQGMQQVQKQLLAWRKVAFQARLNYVPRIYPSRITLYSNSIYTGRYQIRWAELSSAGIHIEIIPGNHETIFLPHNIASLAQALRKHLAPR